MQTWLIYALLTSILAAVAILLEKKTLEKSHAMQFSAILAILIAIIGIPFLIVADYSKINVELIMMMFILSILGALAFLFVAKSVRHMQISISAPLLMMAPIFTALFAYILLGEKLTLIQLLGILLLILGSYILETQPKKSLLEPLRLFVKSKYIHFMIAALILYGISSVGDRFLLTTYEIETMAYVSIMNVFMAINFLIMISLLYDGLKDIKLGVKTGGWWILLIALATIGYRLAQTEALKQAYAGIVIAIKRTSSLLIVLMSGLIFKEGLIARKFIATTVMLLGIILLVI